MDDDDDIDISGDNETSRDRCLLCIARAKHKTLRESNEAYSKWVAHQEHKKVAKTTRVNNDQLREQISKVVDSTYEPSKADTCTKRKELLRVHEQVSLLTKAVSNDVLKHGGKYVPFPTLHPFVARSSKMLRKEVDESERVLIWSTHFVSKKTQDTSKRPSLLEFPYKKLFASTGSRPSYTIKQSLGHKFHVIQNSLNELCDKMRIAMSHCLQCDPIYRGFHVPYSRLENYLEHNLVVEAGKDSSLVLMSQALYLREAQLNMDSVFNNALVYQFLGPPSSLTDWVDKGHALQRKAASWLLHFYPDHLREFLCTFMDSYSKPAMPKIRLLVKTHKSASVDAKGGFSSRPLVGLFRWATTPSSVLLGVASLILLKIDRQHMVLERTA